MASFFLAKQAHRLRAPLWQRRETMTDHYDELSLRSFFWFLQIVQALQAPACHENMVKVGSYILGEFGNLIAGDQRSSPAVQFQLLHSKVNQTVDLFFFFLAIFRHDPIMRTRSSTRFAHPASRPTSLFVKGKPSKT